MSIGNMLQGMAHGSVGDVVFSRLNGEQITRVRNRHPSNPRSVKQLYQRAIMATVSLAYAAGKDIFDHSFQFHPNDSGDQTRFMQINTKLLRDMLANEINNSIQVSIQEGRVAAPGTNTPVPFLYRVSEGTLPDCEMFYREDGTQYGDFLINAVASESETVAEYCNRYGLVSGDILTFLGFAVSISDEPVFTVDGITTRYGKQYPCKFFYARMELKDSALSSTAVMANSPMSTLFECTASLNCNNVSQFLSRRVDNIITIEEFTSLLYNYGAFGMIRSRKNSNLRSTCDLMYHSYEHGIASSYALAAWQQGTASLGSSSLVLEGGDS